MSKSFPELLQEHNGWIQEARIELVRAVAVKDAFTDTRIMELESDLESLNEDRENGEDLTHKLKGLLDGDLVELVGELVEELKGNCDSHCCGYESQACVPSGNCPTLAVLAKANEVLP